ncbi:nicotianamine synthase family protein [Paenibacillus sp. ACRRY]|uniref:nicotianamine synthase family protein n=1 Tax=Paenibacillus sp. ACRRY TaxID=2918208 RepID=UPI001EF62E80|nr:nicotianamine synthase family protein [Paenibacillus sp. ACRRY]MCG7385382.1 methyltransferase domain-containing protein [Paenibacillus sp. ACRRY]
MNTVVDFTRQLNDFLNTFEQLARKYDHSIHHAEQMELAINAYSHWITDKRHEPFWAEKEHEEDTGFKQLVLDLRHQSSRCVAIMEKYRALKLQQGEMEIADYFKNIEECIEKEFGSFHVTSDSKVLLIGSGAFPMTPLLIARRTGAQVVGIDIDEEAIGLGQTVVNSLGAGLRIHLRKASVQELDFTKEATHIIFSSTVAMKYDILDQLHSLTNEHVVVAMRYGNGLKSLFNYPQQETDPLKWRLVDNILRPHDVFDIALYQKPSHVG